MEKSMLKKNIKGSKRIRNLKKDLDFTKIYSSVDAIKELKSGSKVKFDETLEVVCKLGVDPKYSDQMVRGVVKMPNGTGKSVKVAVFAKDAKAEEAKKAGADFVGADELVQAINNGDVSYDVYIATPDMMGMVGRVAKILGPKGKMPNPKLGTVTMNLSKAIEDSKAGQVEFRVEKAGIVHAGIGKLSLDAEKLFENFKAFIDALVKAKPAGAKGEYLKAVSLSSTMGVGLRVDNEQL